LPMPTSPLDFEAICAARTRISPHVHRTPVLTSHSLDLATGATVFLKAENFQKTGAFKARGATNAVMALPAPVAQRGVVTHSSGNHGAAVARAAQLRGVPAYVVMPRNAPRVKQEAVLAYGGTIEWCEPTLQARESVAARLMEETGAALVHPYNDLLVMAGQGTAACEFLETVVDLDLIITPVGGGGLLSGTAVAAKALRRGIRVVGAEPAEADDACRSFYSGVLAPPPAARTIADGLRGALGELTYATIRAQVDEIVTVTEAEIVAALRFIWERMKVLIEPSAAVPVAALLNRRIASAPGQRVGVVLSGGNVDLDALPW
jgi:threonine dehydratase